MAANTASLEKGVKDVQGSLDSMAGFAAKAGKAIASAFVVTEVISAGKKFLDLAGNLTDLSAKTGASTSALQKLKYAAEQNGGSLDGVSNSIVKMNKFLATDSGAPALMAKLGLSFDAVKKMNPGDAFIAIGDAIGKVGNQGLETKAAMDVFGKGGAENLAMFESGLKKTTDQAEQMGLVLSDDVIAAGDQFGDTLGTLFTAGMALLGKVLGPFLPLLQGLANVALVAANAFGVVLGDAINLIVFAGKKAIDWIVNMAEKVFAFASKIPGVSTVIGAMGTAFSAVKDAAGWVHEKIATLNPTLDKGTDALNKHGKGARDSGAGHASAAKAVAAHTVVTAEQTHALELLAGAHKKLAAEQKMQDSAQQKNLETTGAGILQIRHLNTALDSGIKGTRSFAGAVEQVSVAAATFQGNLAGGIKTINQWAESGRQAAHDFAATVAQSLMPGGGGLLSGLKAAGTQVATDFLGGILSQIPGIGGLLANFAGPLVEGFKALIGKIAGLFDRNKGRDIVEDFAKGFGGFDALHTQLNTLGDEGETLWIKLTQGVGRNNPEQARAAIALITKALDDQKLKQAEVQSAAEATSAAQIAANTQAAEAVKSLDTQINSLLKSIENEAPEEVMGIVEQQTRARIAGLQAERDAAQKSLESLTVTMTSSIDRVAEAIENIPSVIRINVESRFTGSGGAEPPSFANGSGGVRDFGTGTLAMLHGREEVVREGQSSSQDRSDEVKQLSRSMVAMMRDQPRAIAIAVSDALALQSRRRR